MKLFLHLKISEEPPKFNANAPLREELKEYVYFDLDNHSEKLVVDTALEAIERSEQIFTLIESETSQPGSMLRIIKRLAKFDQQGKLHIVHNGTNEHIQRMERGFSSTWTKNESLSNVIEKARLLASSEY